MVRNRSTRFAGLFGLAVIIACAPSFKLGRFTSNDSLFGAGVREMRSRHWDNAIQVFEKLTVDLPVRDTLLPLAHFYLAQSHAQRGDHITAAQEYSRLAESFATDSLADDAQFLAGKEYEKLWRRPNLDATYGGEAIAAYQLLLSLYPDSDLRDSAQKQLDRLDQWYALKELTNGMYYFRRKAYDSAIIYFRTVLDRYARTPAVHDALVHLAESYERIKSKDDKAEICASLRERYPKDREATLVCGAAPATAERAKPDPR
jgi:outer membrane assembly lipoprotein YfiO